MAAVSMGMGPGSRGAYVAVHEGHWSAHAVSGDARSLYVFGDNDARRGKGGQAVIRGLPNAAGIPTKRSPGYSDHSYYDDNSLPAHATSIRAACTAVASAAASGRFYRVVFPHDGLGTGLADLPNRAPKTFAHLQAELRRLAEQIEPGASQRLPPHYG